MKSHWFHIHWTGGLGLGWSQGARTQPRFPTWVTATRGLQTSSVTSRGAHEPETRLAAGQELQLRHSDMGRGILTAPSNTYPWFCDSWNEWWFIMYACLESVRRKRNTHANAKWEWFLFPIGFSISDWRTTFRRREIPTVTINQRPSSLQMAVSTQEAWRSFRMN